MCSRSSLFYSCFDTQNMSYRYFESNVFLVFTFAFLALSDGQNIDRSFADVFPIEERFPGSDSLQFQVWAFDDIYDFDLVRVPRVFTPSIDEYVSDTDEHGNCRVLQTVNTRTQHDIVVDNLYTDDTGRTSVYVRKQNGKFYVEGILNDEMRIVPATRPTTPQTSELPVHIAYRLDKPQNGSLKSCDAVEIPSMVNLTERPLDVRLPSTVFVQPEVLLVVDYKISEFFHFDLEAVKKYIAIFFNSVNRRFDSIAMPKIHNIISGIVLTKSEFGQPYVFKVANSTGIDSGKTLLEFGRWMSRQKEVVKTKHDIAYWITALDLQVLQGSYWEAAAVGLGYVGGVCMIGQGENYNVAIGEDVPGKYSGVHTAAHEIGHLYGSAHDGQLVNNPPGNPGGLDCPPSEGYIMSYEFGGKNRFYFSPCSIKQMRFTIESPQALCVRDDPTVKSVTFSNVYPGVEVGLDEQCRVHHGADSSFYVSYESDVCTRRWCSRPNQDGTSIYLMSSGPAYEGSPCGFAMWCINGECVKR